MPLLTKTGGLATGTGVSCPERQMEEAHAKRPNLRGMCSIVGIWAGRRARHRAAPGKPPPPLGPIGGPTLA